jgi:hypothetical protein
LPIDRPPTLYGGIVMVLKIEFENSKNSTDLTVDQIEQEIYNGKGRGFEVGLDFDGREVGGSSGVSRVCWNDKDLSVEIYSGLSTTEAFEIQIKEIKSLYIGKTVTDNYVLIQFKGDS